ncbi:hypothetical protein HK101_007626 [Irineochytrium annulatum]|nr:hypothetical protein HK101_007626 [Irineochytrium annulatum]
MSLYNLTQSTLRIMYQEFEDLQNFPILPPPSHELIFRGIALAITESKKTKSPRLDLTADDFFILCWLSSVDALEVFRMAVDTLDAMASDQSKDPTFGRAYILAPESYLPLPLNIAAGFGSAKVAEYLVETRGIDAFDENGWCLRAAIEFGHSHIVEFLIKRLPEEIEWREYLAAAFVAAADNGHAAIVQRMMKEIAMDPLTGDGAAITLAVKSNRVDVVNVLLDTERARRMSREMMEGCMCECVAVAVKFGFGNMVRALLDWERGAAAARLGLVKRDSGVMVEGYMNARDVTNTLACHAYNEAMKMAPARAGTEEIRAIAGVDVTPVTDTVSKAYDAIVGYFVQGRRKFMDVAKEADTELRNVGEEAKNFYTTMLVAIAAHNVILPMRLGATIMLTPWVGRRIHAMGMTKTLHNWSAWGKKASGALLSRDRTPYTRPGN